MNALTDVFADVFVARDGDATTAGLEILAAALALILIAAGLVCWHQRCKRQKRRQSLMRRLAECEERGMTNRELLERLASDEDKMAAVIGGIIDRVLPDPEPVPSKLRVVR